MRNRAVLSQNRKLLTQSQIFQKQIAAGTKESNHQIEQESQQAQHETVLPKETSCKSGQIERFNSPFSRVRLTDYVTDFTADIYFGEGQRPNHPFGNKISPMSRVRLSTRREFAYWTGQTHLRM